MAGAKLVPTRWPGIYKRGSRWVYQWTDAGGVGRRRTVSSLDEARTGKADREREAREGVPAAVQAPGALTLARYARELYGADVSRPAGSDPLTGRYTGRRGAIREATRAQYRDYFERTWLPALGGRAIDSLRPADLRRVVDQMAARTGTARLADATIRRHFAPMSALMATAAEEGVVPTNVARDVRLPSGRDQLHKFAAGGDDPDEEDLRALTADQVAAFLEIVAPRWRTFFALLAATGLRFSEATALRWSDLELDGSAPHLRVRRSVVWGVMGPPKTRHARRKVPLPHSLVLDLRRRRSDAEWHQDGDLVFPSEHGTPVEMSNLRRRVLKPAAQEADVWPIGFHTFRHTCASQLIARGRNILQVSRWLGHHDPGDRKSVV